VRCDIRRPLPLIPLKAHRLPLCSCIITTIGPRKGKASKNLGESQPIIRLNRSAAPRRVAVDIRKISQNASTGGARSLGSRRHSGHPPGVPFAGASLLSARRRHPRCRSTRDQ
jgi:hypothetical protein